MADCKKCGKETVDFEEQKYELCWECISSQEDLINNNPDLGVITDNEPKTQDLSFIIKDNLGTSLKFAAKKKPVTKTKSKTVRDEGGMPAPEEEEKKTTKKEEEGATTKKSDGNKAPPVVDNEDELKVLRESKEVITKSARAKTRAFALINQAIKETGIFEVSVTVGDKKMTVSSMPFKDKNIEDVIMSTSMEALDMSSNKKKK